MENFKKTITSRIKLMCAYTAVMSAVYVAGVCGFYKRFLAASEFGDFFSGFQTGLFFVLAITSIILISKYSSALKNENTLKEMYIKETDERNRAINEKSGTALYKVMVFVLIGASIVTGYFSSVVFFTILAVIVALIIIYSVMYYHYSHTL